MSKKNKVKENKTNKNEVEKNKVEVTTREEQQETNKTESTIKENNKETNKRKKISTKTKILTVIILLIIVAGAIVTATIGLNFDLRYQQAQKIELYIEQTFENSDIRDIVKDVIGNEPVIVQKVEVFEDTVAITAKEITDEQKQNIITKVNEKYGTELSADSIEVETVPQTRGRDLVEPYLSGFAIATLVILIYLGFKYEKLVVVKVLAKTIVTLVVTQAVLLSIIAITRIPVGRLTMPIVIAVYMLTLLALTTKFEKRLQEEKAKEDK